MSYHKPYRGDYCRAHDLWPSFLIDLFCGWCVSTDQCWHPVCFQALDFLPLDPNYIVSGSTDRQVRIWDLRRKACVISYKHHQDSVKEVLFSPHGKWITSAGIDGIIQVYQWQAGKLLRELVHAKNSAVYSLAFHPNDLLLASAGQNGIVKFWDLETFEPVSSTEKDALPIRCIRFQKDGSSLLAGLSLHSLIDSDQQNLLLKSRGRQQVDTCASQVSGWLSITVVSLYPVQDICLWFNCYTWFWFNYQMLMVRQGSRCVCQLSWFTFQRNPVAESWFCIGYTSCKLGLFDTWGFVRVHVWVYILGSSLRNITFTTVSTDYSMAVSCIGFHYALEYMRSRKVYSWKIFHFPPQWSFFFDETPFFYVRPVTSR